MWKSKALVFSIKDIWGNINGFGYRRVIEDNNDKPPKYWNDRDKESEENSICFYASKLCAISNLYEGLKPQQETYQNILSLNKDGIKEYFLKEESYFNCKLPKYFIFDDVLKWANDKLSVLESGNNQFPYNDYKSTEDVNYKILGNKNGEYVWRQYQIMNPILYIKLVNVISGKREELKNHFKKIFKYKIKSNVLRCQ